MIRWWVEGFMKKLITRVLIITFSVALAITLMVNFPLQMILDIRSFRQSSADNFWQIKNIIDENRKELEHVKADFAEECIIRARTAAYISLHYPTVIEDIEEAKLVSSLLQVDELHFFTPDGAIYAGTHPEYYGFNFDSGEQMHFFAPMLEDHSLELCQNVMPNTAEKKLMQYAAVWSPDFSKIVQVGLTPKRVLEEIEGNNISEIFAQMPTDNASTFYAISTANNILLGSSDKELVGKTADELGLHFDNPSSNITWGYQKIEGKSSYYAMVQLDDLIIVKACPTDNLHRDILENSFFICVYFIVLFMILMIGSYAFLERKIIRSILNINSELKTIEQGNWDVELSENSTAEFAELSKYINAMVASLLTYVTKTSKALELSQVPIGICEYIPESDTLIATSRVQTILGLSEVEYEAMKQQPSLFNEYLESICEFENGHGESVYYLEKEKRYLRIESFMYNQSKMTILIDITKDILEKQSIAKERDTDQLTGLYNRGAFYRTMDSLFKNVEALKVSVVIMIDLDNLKYVNDKYGHADGDLYLRGFTEVLNTCQVKKGMAARIGGDEFVLFVYGMDEESEAEDVLYTLQETCDQKTIVLQNGETIQLGYSFGYTFIPREGEDYQEIIKLADTRMYEQKKKRKESKKPLISSGK